MYHELTYERVRLRRTARILTALVVVLLAFALVVSFFTFRETARKQGASSLRDSIVNAAIQCCAVEGSYPSSLAHLEQHYGLVVNNADYIIYYEWLGDNVPPSVAVTLR